MSTAPLPAKINLALVVGPDAARTASTRSRPSCSASTSATGSRSSRRRRARRRRLRRRHDRPARARGARRRRRSRAPAGVRTSRSASRSPRASAAAAPTRRRRCGSRTSRSSSRSRASACTSSPRRSAPTSRSSSQPGPQLGTGDGTDARAARPAAGLRGAAPPAARREQALDRRGLRGLRPARGRASTSAAAALLERLAAVPRPPTSRRCRRTTSPRRRSPPSCARSVPSAPTSAAPARPSTALSTTGRAAAARLPPLGPSGGPGSRHQRGTFDAMGAGDPARRATLEAGRWLRDHRYRLTLWIAAVEGLLVFVHVIPRRVMCSRSSRSASGGRSARNRSRCATSAPGELDLRRRSSHRPLVPYPWSSLIFAIADRRRSRSPSAR